MKASLTPAGGYDRANIPEPGDREETAREYDLDSWRTEFSEAWNVGEEQRDHANEDMRFVMVPGAQWESWIGDEFATNRPRMEMDQVYEKINIFLAQYDEANMGVTFSPATGSSTTLDDAKIMNGLFRADMRRNNGQYAVDNAVREGAIGGPGAFRFRAEFEDPDDDENLNQVICAEPIHGAYNSVIWDPNAKRYDKRDARYCYVITFMTRDAYRERFGDVPPASVPVANNRGQFDWNPPAGVYVAERYWIEEEIKTSVLLYHPTLGGSLSLFEDEFKLSLPELEAAGYEEVRRRRKTVKTVKKCVFSGQEMLEEPVRVAGKYIPIIPFYAFWLYVDDTERYMGLIRKQKDPQRLFNMQASSLAELAATSVKEVPIFAPEQMVGPGIKEQWSEAHLGNFNYLLANPLRDEGGQIIQTGPLGFSKPPQVSPAMAAVLELTAGYIRETGTLMPTEMPNREISGKAISQLNKRVDLKTHGIMANLYTTLVLAGDVYKEMAREIYSDERVVRLLESDGREREITINETAFDQTSGIPEARNMITQARLNTYPEAGPSWASQVEEAKITYAELLRNMQPDNPYYAIVLTEFLSLLAGTTDGFTEFVRTKQLEMGLRDPQTPEEQQMVQQMQQKASEPTPQDQLVLAAAAKEQAAAQETAARIPGHQADAAEKMSQIGVNESQIRLNEAKAAGELADTGESGFARAARVLQFPRTSQGAQ